MSGLGWSDVIGNTAAVAAVREQAQRTDGVRDNLLLVGAGGSGCTLIARLALKDAQRTGWPPGVLCTDVQRIYQMAGLWREGAAWPEMPFRAPHHSVSRPGLFGGGMAGRWARPGEVTLAHGGILFLGELPEFRRERLEALRTVADTGEITLRPGVTLPASFWLLASAAPCACGWRGYSSRPSRPCRCEGTSEDAAYQRRLHRFQGLLKLRRVDVPGATAAEIKQARKAS